MTRPNEYHWTFGNGCHISFPNAGEPVVESSVLITGDEGCASISNQNGDLLFYTDGRTLYDRNNTLIANNLGGHTSSANSAIIVPPVSGGVRYHVFTMDSSSKARPNQGPNTTPLRYTGIDVANPNDINNLVVTVGSPTVDVDHPDHGTDWAASESLAATSHIDCGKYWVIALDARNNEWLSFLIDSDAGPNPINTKVSPYAAPLPASNVYGMKISSDGSMLAHANTQHPVANSYNPAAPAQNLSSVDLFNFNRANGDITYHSQIREFRRDPTPYGLEFSPNMQYLYFTDYAAGILHRHSIGADSTLSASPEIYRKSTGQIGALQLGPNGKIYGVKRGLRSLFSIDFPDAPLTSPSTTSQNQLDVGFQETAKAAGGNNLNLGSSAVLGLPTFTRLADDCVDGNCEGVADEVNLQLEEQMAEHVNKMALCNAEQGPNGNPLPNDWACEPADTPDYQPHISITWGDSACDCIESDDTEIMNITICNPYSNVDFKNVTANRLRVIMDDGSEIPVLPDGTPSVQLVPIGPYCFDDIDPCSCISREFVLRNRGAVHGAYKILIEGVCFDVCTHVNTQECFTFDICKD